MRFFTYCMTQRLFNILIALVLISSCAAGKPDNSGQPPSHELWTELLQKHVSSNGQVDYPGFKDDSILLEQYLDTLRANHPDPETWTRNERLAYWINAYNAFTIELIIKHYPIASIKDIKRWNIPFLNTPWTIKFIEIGGEKYDLDAIEHKILRKEFDEPRIHFAIVCASISCPQLRTEAYTADSIDTQLDEQAHQFINDPARNELDAQNPKLSSIFNWFKGDFTEGQTLVRYINKYAETPVNEDADVDYKDYNWSLNE